MTARILGIDPGAGGAHALLVGGKLRDLKDMPCLVISRGKRDVRQVDAHLLAAQIRPLLPLDKAFIEKVGAMPGQGVSSMFAFGRAAGVVEGVLAGLGVPFDFVAPNRWKQEMNIPSGAAKDTSRHRAIREWPQWSLDFSRSKDDGRAEAALIALHGARQFSRYGLSKQAFEEALAAL